MKTGFIIAVSVIGGVFLLLLFLNSMLALLRIKLKKRIRNRFDFKEIIHATTSANFLGARKKGGWQIKGNGALVLTPDRLCFIRGVPQTEYEIPIDSITQVSLPKSFNGKTVFSKLLCVHYGVGSGKDAMAWAVKDPEKWKTDVEALMKNNQ